MHEKSTVIENVRRALGRVEPLASPPVPPSIDEPITRLVSSDIGLPELFAKMAEQNKIGLDRVTVDQLGTKLAAYLKAKGCDRVALPNSPLLNQLGLLESLRAAGLDARRWDQITLDELYDFDAGITDVYAAVAETGSLVIRASKDHGRSLSLVPPIHVAIVEPRNFLPDLIDLFDKLAIDSCGSNTVIITGPSKTSDIEMNLVTGVHGPTTVQVFLLV
jgi:L-lactate dehydrogenase complex protein LldG